MILVIKDFDIPKGNPNLVKTAYPCNLIVSRNGEVELSIQDGARYSCTAISAPHGDLIDRNYLLDILNKVPTERMKILQLVKEMIEKAPTVIAAEE